MGASIKQGGGGGRRARRRSHAPMAEINVTPFVDVMLVLLIIFMVAAPLLTAGIPLELPKAAGQPLRPQDKEPVVVSVTRDGSVYLGGESQAAVRLDELGAKLKAVATARGGLQDPIFVRGDKAVLYGVVVKVLERIEKAGFTRVALVTEID
ncbi:MAG: protein TolR [Pseudomonadota bacterium]